MTVLVQVNLCGLRAVARTFLDEVMNLFIDWIRSPLSHSGKGGSGRAYERTNDHPQSSRTMWLWADYLSNLTRESFSAAPFRSNLNE